MDTYSKNYIRLNRDLHDSPKGFGGDGHRRVKDIIPTIEKFKTVTVLDYGAGKGTLKEELLKTHPELQIRNYDPAVKAFRKKPEGKFDLVVCTDVLEHIEPEYLENVIQELYNYTGRVAYLLIQCTEANRLLPDGRNAHLIQEQPLWWEARLQKYPWKIRESSFLSDKTTPGKIKKVSYVMEK